MMVLKVFQVKNCSVEKLKIIKEGHNSDNKLGCAALYLAAAEGILYRRY